MTAASSPEVPIGEDDLQAWIDGRLPSSRRDAVEAWFATNPEVAARLRSMASQQEKLRAVLQLKHDEPMPARLRVANLVAARRVARWQGMRRVASVCVWLVAGGAMGWAGHATLSDATRDRAPAATAMATRPMVAEAIAAHRVFAADLGRPVEVAAAQEAQLVTWLSNRLGRPLAAPDLLPQGYRLIGGRLLAGAGGDPAAQLMYEDARRLRLTVYLRADHAGPTGTEFRFSDDPAQGVTAFWWVDRGFGYAVSAEGLDRPVLLSVAEAVHRQVTQRGTPSPSL